VSPRLHHIAGEPFACYRRERGFCGVERMPGRENAPHGTCSKYRSGCHCAECRAANARYELARRKGAAIDRRVRRIVADAGSLTPQQMDLLRNLLPAPTDAS
jgi:hypothetical protein